MSKTLTPLMDPPFESANTATAFASSTALRKGHTQWFAYEGAVNLT
jgi:hypothetical protein